MLRAVSMPAVGFDVLSLAARGSVSVGRESEAGIRLESPDVPLLLSRRHAALRADHNTSNSGGGVTFTLTDLDSTNGTYVSRANSDAASALSKLPAHSPWELQQGDVVAFGGPHTIIVNGVTTRNPFVFVFYAPLCRSAGAEAVASGNDVVQGVDQQLGGTGARHHHHYYHTRAAAAAAAAAAADKTADLHSNMALLRRGDSDTAAAAAKPAAAAGPYALPCRALSVPEQGHTRGCCGQQPPQCALGAGAEAAGHAHPQHQQQQQQQQQGDGGGGGGTLRSILSSHLSCPVCGDLLVASHALTCGHLVCGPCLVEHSARVGACPSCREPLAGVPVRCFQVDSTVADAALLLGCGDPTHHERRRERQAAWDAAVAAGVAQGWAREMAERRQRASEQAARHHLAFMGVEA